LQEVSRSSLAGRVLRSATLFVLTGLALVLAAAAAIVVAPPTALVRDTLVAHVKRTTGRDLDIAGPIALRLLPRVSVRLRDVTLSAPPAMPGAPLLQAEELSIELNPLPLLMREVVVERLVLHRPVVALRVDNAGRRSWDFAAIHDLRDGHRIRLAQAVQTRGPDGRLLPRELQDFVRNSGDGAVGRQKPAGINDLSLADVSITAGEVRFSDARTTMAFNLEAIDGRLSLKDLSGPLTAAGQFVHDGERIVFDVAVTSPRSFLADQPAKLAIRLAARSGSLEYSGMVTGAGTPSLDGRVALAAASVDDLTRLLRLPVSGLDPLGAASFSGHVKFVGSRVTITEAKLSAAGTAASGTVSLDVGGPRPQAKANITVAALDLDRLLALEPVLAPSARPTGPPGSPAPRPKETQAGRFAPSAGGLAPPASIEDLLNRPDPGAMPAPDAAEPARRPGTAVRGFSRRAGPGWSSEPLNPALLRLVDLDGRFEFAGIAAGPLRAGAAQAVAQLKAGVLKVEIPRAEVFDGTIKGVVSVDAREPDITLGVNLSGEGVAAQPLLQAISSVELIDGRGRFSLAVSAKGGSERELIGTLAGKADLKLADGALLGWDISQSIAALAQGRVPRLERTSGSRTPFRELSGTFQIAHGVARNQDLKVDSPALRATGSGVINLVDRNMNMLVKTEAAGSGGLEVPLRIAGPLDKVSVVPDVGAVLRSPQAQEALRKLKDGDVDGALRDVLGGGAKADEKIGKARELLKQFLAR
jgi:AsmA protein